MSSVKNDDNLSMRHSAITCSPWRQDFPAFDQFHKQGLIWLDSAATTQKPQAVIETLIHYYRDGCANVHRAQHSLGKQVTEAFEAVRCKVADFLRAATEEEIVFTRSTTEAINLLAYGLEKTLPCTGNIVVSALEHHANLLPWQQLAKRKALTLRVLPINAAGVIDLEAAKTLIDEHTQLVAISQMSNVFGTLQPVEAIAQLTKKYNAYFIVDGAQGIVHQSTDVGRLGCDFYVFSGHKLYAPEGVGILYGKKLLLETLTPWQFGGEMVLTASYDQTSFRPPPLGLEAGTPAIGAVLGLGAAIDYLRAQDQDTCRHYEQQLFELLITGLMQREGISLLGKPQVGLVSFYVKDTHHTDLGLLLTEQNIAVRAGQHCCMPLYNSLGLKGAVRVSLGIYNDLNDVQCFFTALDKAIELLQ